MSKYFVEVQVRQHKEGVSSHVSLTTMEVENKNTNICTISSEHVVASRHSSFGASSAVGTVTNAFTIGGIPVQGTVFSEAHDVDVADADSIFRIEVTSEQYRQAVQEQSIMEDKVSCGDILYSFYGDRFLSSAITGLANFATENHEMLCERRESAPESVVESEDAFGTPLPPYDFAQEALSRRIDSRNCVSYAFEILNKMGLNLDIPILPLDVPHLLKANGFTVIDRNVAPVTETRLPEAQPEPAKVEKSHSFWGMMFSFFSSAPSTDRTMRADSNYEADTSFSSDTVRSDSLQTVSSSDAEIAPSSQSSAAASDDSAAFKAFNLF